MRRNFVAEIQSLPKFGRPFCRTVVICFKVVKQDFHAVRRLRNNNNKHGGENAEHDKIAQHNRERNNVFFAGSMSLFEQSSLKYRCGNIDYVCNHQSAQYRHQNRCRSGNYSSHRRKMLKHFIKSNADENYKKHPSAVSPKCAQFTQNLSPLLQLRVLFFHCDCSSAVVPIYSESFPSLSFFSDSADLCSFTQDLI